MTIRDQVRAYIAAHPEAKRRHIMAALKLDERQVDNALRVIRHGNQPTRRKPKAKPVKATRPVNIPPAHFLSVW